MKSGATRRHPATVESLYFQGVEDGEGTPTWGPRPFYGFRRDPQKFKKGRAYKGSGEETCLIGLSPALSVDSRPDAAAFLTSHKASV